MYNPETHTHIFLRCPHCGSEKKLFKDLGEQLKGEGKVGGGWAFCYQHQIQIAIDKRRVMILPIGVTAPGYETITDICAECGTVYATSVREISGRTELDNKNPQKRTPPFSTS